MNLYVTVSDQHDLTGIQLGFTDTPCYWRDKNLCESVIEDELSPLFEDCCNKGRDLRKYEIDTSERVRYVSMRMKGGRYYTGIRLYNDDMDFILDETWNDINSDPWTDPQLIPVGKQIIGLKANTSSNKVRNLSFVLGPSYNDF